MFWTATPLSMATSCFTRMGKVEVSDLSTFSLIFFLSYFNHPRELTVALHCVLECFSLLATDIGIFCWCLPHGLQRKVCLDPSFSKQNEDLLKGSDQLSWYCLGSLIAACLTLGRLKTQLLLSTIRLGTSAVSTWYWGLRGFLESCWFSAHAGSQID